MTLGELASNSATYICGCVFRAERDVKLVVFYRNGDLAMLCGEPHHFDEDPGKLVGLGHLLQRHPALKELEVQPGFEAEEIGDGIWQYMAVNAG